MTRSQTSLSCPETSESDIEPVEERTVEDHHSESIQSQIIHQEPNEKIVFIHHLDKFSLPEGYPKSIADIIRSMTTPSDLLDSFVPTKLNQILKIRFVYSLPSYLFSPIIRENGPVVRRRDIEEIRRLEKLEEERKRKIWQDTPKRYKGWMSGKCIRKYGKFVIISSYRFICYKIIFIVR